jgi:glycosyltransferase involved in cell wall biosynthesis
MKISVVMTTYNGGKYLEQQIESILAQTLQPAEFIVCDDCSADGTVAILEKYSKLHRLTYAVNEKQLGLIDNFRKAVALAASDNYVALSDQDDEWLPDKLERSAALLQKMDQSLPCMVHTDLILVDEQGNVLNNSFRNELGQANYQHNLQSLLFGNFVTGCTMMINPELKRFFAEMPGNIRFHDAWIALAAFTFGETAEVLEPTIRYRKHDNNLSITAGTKPRNRYRSTMDQLIKAINGKDDFLSLQLETARKFYDQYHFDMTADKKAYFERFLDLASKPYFIKKIAFGRMVRHFKL